MNTKLFHHKQSEHKIVNVNEKHDETLTFGNRVSDNVASYVGSWRFVFLMTTLLALWIIWNDIPFLPHFDPAPFILLNLCLSFIAGYTAPFILMSQNLQAAKDRIAAEHDYQVNLKSEEEVRGLISHLDMQDQKILETIQEQTKQTLILMAQNEELAKQTTLLLQIAQQKQQEQ